MKFRSTLFFCTISLLLFPVHGQEALPMFDGQTLEGWKVKAGDEAFWKVENGTIVADSNGKKMPRNTYLWSEKKYDHFEFRCQFKLTGDPETGVINSGIQFRSANKDGHPVGYQADIGGPDWWGGIFEEGGRRRLVKADMNEVLPAIKENDWNEYIIRANGPRIQLWINGVETCHYIEKKGSIDDRGYFALQLHKGGVCKIEFKDITLKKLDGGVDPSDREAWWAAKARITYLELQVSNIPQTPEEELKKFELADGYVAELVAQESEGIGKFVTVDFDNQGRMWSMTALDYPVDANKEKTKAENLFKNGGQDKILVFDTPTVEGVQTPRVFATDLAIPLGVMPYKDGAIAQYGSDIRFYRDEDGDGVSEKHEVLLTGFGIQDSHLFPHLFTRGPGGWMYFSQGLSNQSVVRRPDGKAFASGPESVKYERCRIARMKLDGSDFQYTTTGPNNAWGMVTGRDGEWFIQEANDKGYPVAPYEFGIFLNTGGTPKIKPYQPILPPIFDTAIMGGTGLSGLALAEDRNSPFAEDGKKTFYIANPLTSSIQVVTAEPLGNNRFKWQKQENLLTSGDKWFRPVAIKFGPDGALYVVDWYNKIIAHGEVDQNHPDRDKIRGRIWRIRHKDQARVDPPNLAKADNSELLELLSHDSALTQRQAWLEMIDRNATDLVPKLKQLVVDTSEILDVRLAALWATEGLGGVDNELLSTVANDKEANLRAEVIRIAGRTISVEDFAVLAKAAAKDPADRVRAALGEALVCLPEANAEAMHAAALLGNEALTEGDQLTVYSREFERFLARWAMEKNTKATSAMLSSTGDLPVENRLLAMQALQPDEAALAFLPMIPKLDRDLSTIELSLITSQLSQPKVLSGFKQLLDDPARQKSMLKALSKADPSSSNVKLNELLVDACRQLLKRESSAESQTLVIETAQRHRLNSLRSDIGSWLTTESDTAMLSSGLRCLRELGSVDRELCLKLIGHQDQGVQQEALIALSTAAGTETIAKAAEHWSILSATGQQSAIDGLVNSKEKSAAFAEAVLAGDFGELDSGSIEKLIISLDDHPSAKELMKKMGDSVPLVIRLEPGKGNLINSKINLGKEFTVESWIRLIGKPSANEVVLTGRKPAISFTKGKLSIQAAAGKRQKVIVGAKTSVASGQWAHYAVTRDNSGICRIYIDGVLNATSKKSALSNFKGLAIGASPGKAKLELMEFRVWNKALKESAIREGMQVSYAGETLPAELAHRYSGDADNLPVKGKVQISPSSDAPQMITATKAAELAATFERYEKMVKADGDVEQGKLMYQGACAACHMVNGVGGKIGPDLSGAGTMGDIALLRNILTPNAALEASYYRHDLKLRDGSFISGFMVSEDDQTMTVRLIGADDRIVSKSDIQSHNISKRSLMPEGLISGLNDQQVADMFAYLRTLK